MCMDFASINKACPKYSYPLPNIDRLVDSSVGYKVVDFLDAFRGYHQIFMAEDGENNLRHGVWHLLLESRGLGVEERRGHIAEDGQQGVLYLDWPKHENLCG
ncbi:hypothetical protein LIER_24996 [Lithospermum erythrorhizon]|uniref:Uncharacterized protein n=1 Tax=Lithospermum erythrorhizon TaxID=34254 RepID=A0AAV3R393_LITER